MRRMENGLLFSILLNHVFTTTTLIVVKWNTIQLSFFHRWMLLRHHGLLHREKILEMVSHQKCASEYLDFSSSRMNEKSLSLWPVSLDTVNSQLTSTHTHRRLHASRVIDTHLGRERPYPPRALVCCRFERFHWYGVVL